MRLGLRSKFWLIVLLAVAVCGGIGFVGLRQQIAGMEEISRIGADAISEASQLSEQRRALALAQMLAEAIINPIYYFDLVQIGAAARSALRQPDVAYVLVYDAEGRILHDASPDIERFGQRMGDEMATAVMVAAEPLVQMDERVIDAAVPVTLGGERIGGVRVGISRQVPSLFEKQVLASIQTGMERWRDRMQSLIGMLLLGLMVSILLVALLISRGLVRPVQRLALAARQMEQGNYAVEFLTPSRCDEIGELEDAFVRMGRSVDRHDRDIRRLAFSDALTGLPNRVAFRESLNARVLAAERDGHQLALMFIDLDDFKRINDTLGHDIGDEVLTQFGMRILNATREPDDGHVEVARFGGDEFVVLLHGTEVRDRASRLAQTFLAQMRRPITVGGQSIVLAASIGITLYPQDGTQPATLLKNADIAMYRAKLDGKNCLRFYTRDMDMVMEREMQLEQDLHLALDRGELSVVYQPIHSLQSGRIIGAEALVRWNHPQRGPMATELFIAVAEQTGQIEAIGRFVLKVACAEAATWPQVDGVAPFVSVNISARQLRQGALPDLVDAELRESGLPPARLHLELTETMMFSLEQEAIGACARLRAAGVRIWLDDFGTGFSGLSHLRRVPIDGVKIDRSFVSGMLDDADDLALTAAIIAMAHSLGIVVTAEGVESQGQFDALEARGCDNLQGFLLGRPMSAADLVRELGG